MFNYKQLDFWNWSFNIWLKLSYITHSALCCVANSRLSRAWHRICIHEYMHRTRSLKPEFSEISWSKCLLLPVIVEASILSLSLFVAITKLHITSRLYSVLHQPTTCLVFGLYTKPEFLTDSPETHCPLQKHPNYYTATTLVRPL